MSSENDPLDDPLIKASILSKPYRHCAGCGGYHRPEKRCAAEDYVEFHPGEWYCHWCCSGHPHGVSCERIKTGELP